MLLWPRIVVIINEAIASSRPKKREGKNVSFSDFNITSTLAGIDAAVIKKAAAGSDSQTVSVSVNPKAEPVDPLANLKNANEASKNSPTAENKPSEAAQGCPVKDSDKPPCKCAKIHIDLRSTTVQWQTQFDPLWGDKTAQNVAC